MSAPSWTDAVAVPGGLLAGPLLLHNVRRIEPLDDGVALHRLPASLAAQIEPGTRSVQANTTGCELRFRLAGERATIALRCHLPAERARRPGHGLAEVWFGGVPGWWEITPIAIGTEWTTVEIRRPRAGGAPVAPWHPDLVRLRLPFERGTHVGAIDGELAPPQPGDAPARRLLCYGSSITHGSSAMTASGSWAWRVADHLGWDLCNLGMPGNCRLEPAIAAAMAADPHWDLATCELGANVFGAWEPERFAAAVDAFLAALAATTRPVLVTDLFPSAMDGDPQRREAYAAAVAAAARRHGRAWIPGASFALGPGGLTTDQVHPSETGMAAIARRWCAVLDGLGQGLMAAGA
jgi:hypothetical protein